MSQYAYAGYFRVLRYEPDGDDMILELDCHDIDVPNAEVVLCEWNSLWDSTSIEGQFFFRGQWITHPTLGSLIESSCNWQDIAYTRHPTQPTNWQVLKVK